MDFWGWFLLAVAVGGGLLAVAVLADRHARRRTSGEGEPAPERGIAAVDAQVPAYITQDEVDALPAPGRGVPGDLPHKGEGFGFGHAHPDFATRASGADWARPRILVVDGEVDTMRQLLAPLSAATADAPLIVVAAGFAPEVLTTLAANRRAVGLPVVAAVAGPEADDGWPSSRARTRSPRRTFARATSPSARSARPRDGRARCAPPG